MYSCGHWIILCCRRKPTCWIVRKAAVPVALWQATGIPPGSSARACAQRGNSGTWESQVSPCVRCGDREAVPWRIKPRRCIGLHPAYSETHDYVRDTNKGMHARYRVRIAKSERTREGHLAVLAEHSTDGSVNGIGKVGK